MIVNLAQTRPWVKQTNRDNKQRGKENKIVMVLSFNWGKINIVAPD